jgi:hypothetical protein
MTITIKPTSVDTAYKFKAILETPNNRKYFYGNTRAEALAKVLVHLLEPTLDERARP